MMFKFILFAIVAVYFSVANAGGNFTLKCHESSSMYRTLSDACENMGIFCMDSDKKIELVIPEGNSSGSKVEIHAKMDQMVWITGQGKDKSTLWKSNIELHGPGNFTLEKFGMTGCDCNYTTQSICYSADACVQHAGSASKGTTDLMSMKFWNVKKIAVKTKRPTQITDSEFWKITSGPAVKVDKDNLYVSQSAFNNIQGRAIVFSSSANGMLNVKGSKFDNCSAVEGGGAIRFGRYNNGIHLSNSTFKDCSTSGKGGGIYFLGHLEANNCMFKNCSAGSDGGAVYQDFSSSVDSLDGKIFANITDCNFDNCMVTSEPPYFNDGYHFGAAVSIKYGNISKENEFVGNKLNIGSKLVKKRLDTDCKKNQLCCLAVLEREEKKCVGKNTEHKKGGKGGGASSNKFMVVMILILIIGGIGGGWWFWHSKKLQSQRDVLLDDEYQNMDDMDGMDTL